MSSIINCRKGLLRSSQNGIEFSENGYSWTLVNGSSLTRGVVDLLSDGDDIFACCPNGILHSSDNGCNWSLRNSNGIFQRLAGDKRCLFATSNEGVFCSKDGGYTWTLTSH